MGQKREGNEMISNTIISSYIVVAKRESVFYLYFFSSHYDCCHCEILLATQKRKKAKKKKMLRCICTMCVYIAALHCCRVVAQVGKESQEQPNWPTTYLGQIPQNEHQSKANCVCNMMKACVCVCICVCVMSIL